MAVSIEQLRRFTEQLGFEFEEGEAAGGAVLAINVPTETPKGTKELTIFVKSYDNGEMFEATMADFLSTELHQKSEHKLKFLFYLLHKAWETKFGTPEVDKDGEVRFLVEIPLLDAEMTLKQFERILRVATQTAVEIALEGGQILMDGTMPDSDESDINDRMRQAVVAMIEMVGTAEGRAKLEEIAASEKAPDLLRSMARKLLQAPQAPDAL
jgi:hypothetical protein